MRDKPKNSAAIIVCSILILLSIFVGGIILNGKDNSKKYSDNLISILKVKEQISVQEVFAFDFSRAYVFKDSYISGEGFTKAYNLDISINQVGNTDQENIGRVVFVDDTGNFVFEYQYFENELIAIKKGMVIYPETKIRKCASRIEGVTCFEFMSFEYY